MADEGNKKMPGDELDPDAPPSAEEIAASQRLRDALEDPSLPSDDAELARALRAAWAPDAIAEDELGALVEGSLDPEEVRAAARLRDALEGAASGGAAGASPEAELAAALACAWRPSAIGDAEHRAILARALGAGADGAGAKVIALRTRPRAVVVRAAFGFAGAVALAASVLLVVQRASRESEAAPLAQTRSTQELFREPFRAGDASARIDRIALARASDFRDNRFARWGVR